MPGLVLGDVGEAGDCVVTAGMRKQNGAVRK
jgi:hypothetical protein